MEKAVDEGLVRSIGVSNFRPHHLDALLKTARITPAQIAIRWSLQKGFNPLPKSVTPNRIFENFDVFDFKLSEDDMEVINALKGIGKEALVQII